MPEQRVFAPGESIGAFEVKRVLATGIHSIVYEAAPDPARRKEVLARGAARVAIKVARLDVLEDPRARKQLTERIEREYRILSSLMQPGHPNIVKVYESGSEKGLPFFVMEYINGPSMKAVLATRPPLAQMLEVFRKVNVAMAFLHQQGICHRDLRPANILLRDGEPILIDFGCSLPSGHPVAVPDMLLGLLN